MMKKSKGNFPEGLGVEASINLYNKVGCRDGDFLFNWLHDIYKKIFLPSVDSNYREVLAADKTKLTVYDVLVDDLADNYKIRNRDLLEKAIRLPWSTDNYSNEYLKVVKKVWLDSIGSIEKYPRYEEYKELFYFDLAQVLDSMRYSFLVNTTEIDNLLEDKIYPHHGVMVILHCDMDLMCSPDFDKKELSKLRPIFHWTQEVSHIGNMLNTYPREIKERDFSAPIISLGLRKDLIKRDDIINNPEAAEEKLESLLPYFRERVEENFTKIEKQAEKVKGIDMNEFSGRLREVYKGFLKRKHYWK